MSKLVVGLLSDGRYVAATTGSPYFCTVADTEEALREKIHAAANFYRKAREAVPREPMKPRVGLVVEHIIPHLIEQWAPARSPDHEEDRAYA